MSFMPVILWSDALVFLLLAATGTAAWYVRRHEHLLLPWRRVAHNSMAMVSLLVARLAAGVVFWLVGFDIIYALQDYEFDRTHGLRSLVVAWGPRNALHAAFLVHMVMCGLLLAFGFLCRFGIAYLIGWLIIAGCLVLEHWIARHRSLNWINVAFFRLNAVVSAVFLVVVTAEVVFQGGFKLK